MQLDLSGQIFLPRFAPCGAAWARGKTAGTPAVLGYLAAFGRSRGHRSRLLARSAPGSLPFRQRCRNTRGAELRAAESPTSVLRGQAESMLLQWCTASGASWRQPHHRR